MLIEDIKHEFTTGTYNAFRCHQIKALDELENFTEKEFMKLRRIGIGKLNEIKTVMQKYDVNFMKLNPAINTRKRNLFYILLRPGHEYIVFHRQIIGFDKPCAIFNYGDCTVTKYQALKGAKIFCKQMNTLYPTKVTF